MGSARQFNPSELEWMDKPQPVTAELMGDLRNLRQLSRLFGSYSLVMRFMRRWLDSGARLRIADLATASGDIPRLIIDYARTIGATIQLDEIDQQRATLEIARSLSAGYPEISFKQADILEFGQTAEYDVVLCTLVLHHFTEEDAV